MNVATKAMGMRRMVVVVIESERVSEWVVFHPLTIPHHDPFVKYQMIPFPRLAL